MVNLTREEILTQLRRLGVNSSSDLKKYLREYKTYFTHSNNLPRQEVILEKCKGIFFILVKAMKKIPYNSTEKNYNLNE